MHDRTEVLYVSPLKALGNDIQKNLEVPLGEILQMAGERGLLMPEIRTAVRTGDTLMHERRAMLKRPPHILVTTPESLYILLTAEKSRAILRDVETVIVDEIHAVADDKRGAHLALSLERLEALTHRPPVRIGLSATQKPIEEVAHFLTGNGRPDPVIVNVGHKRKLDLAVEVPGTSTRPGRHQRNVGRNLRPPRRAGRAASLHAGLRQHAAAGRTGRAPSGRADSAKTMSPRIMAACRASCVSPPRRS